jgi:hypothetical protein
MYVTPTFHDCPTCIAYSSRRLPVLAPAMARRLRDTGETSAEILTRYMTGVHDRHVAGLSLEVTA